MLLVFSIYLLPNDTLFFTLNHLAPMTALLIFYKKIYKGAIFDIHIIPN